MGCIVSFRDCLLYRHSPLLKLYPVGPILMKFGHDSVCRVRKYRITFLLGISWQCQFKETVAVSGTCFGMLSTVVFHSYIFRSVTNLKTVQTKKKFMFLRIYNSCLRYNLTFKPDKNKNWEHRNYWTVKCPTTWNRRMFYFYWAFLSSQVQIIPIIICCLFFPLKPSARHFLNDCCTVGSESELNLGGCLRS